MLKQNQQKAHASCVFRTLAFLRRWGVTPRDNFAVGGAEEGGGSPRLHGVLG